MASDGVPLKLLFTFFGESQSGNRQDLVIKLDKIIYNEICDDNIIVPMLNYN